MRYFWEGLLSFDCSETSFTNISPLGVVRIGADGRRHARGDPLGPGGRLRPVEAADLVEVGDGADGRQASERDAVQVAAAAGHPRPSQAEAVRVPRGPVQLPGVPLSSETHGSYFESRQLSSYLLYSNSATVSGFT